MSRDYPYTEADREEECHIALHNQKAWEQDLERFQSIGAQSRAVAIFWDMDAFNARNGNEFDVGYYCYLRGIDYALEPVITQELRDGRMFRKL